MNTINTAGCCAGPGAAAHAVHHVYQSKPLTSTLHLIVENKLKSMCEYDISIKIVQGAILHALASGYD